MSMSTYQPTKSGTRSVTKPKSLRFSAQSSFDHSQLSSPVSPALASPTQARYSNSLLTDVLPDNKNHSPSSKRRVTRQRSTGDLLQQTDVTVVKKAAEGFLINTFDKAAFAPYPLEISTLCVDLNTYIVSCLVFGRTFCDSNNDAFEIGFGTQDEIGMTKLFNVLLDLYFKQDRCQRSGVLAGVKDKRKLAEQLVNNVVVKVMESRHSTAAAMMSVITDHGDIGGRLSKKSAVMSLILHGVMQSLRRRYILEEREGAFNVRWQCFTQYSRNLGTHKIVVGVSVKPRQRLVHTWCCDDLFARLLKLGQDAVILVGDDLSRHNEMAFARAKNEEDGRVAARKSAEPLWRSIKESYSKLRLEDQDRIKLWSWKVLEDHAPYMEAVKVCRKYYEQDDYIRCSVDRIAELYVKTRSLSSKKMAKKLQHSVDYILEELVLLIAGVVCPDTGVHYDQMLYPCDILHADQAVRAGPASFEAMVNQLQIDAQFVELRREIMNAMKVENVGHGYPLLPQ